MSADLSRLQDLIDAFSRQTIVVLGDLVADEFVFGEISRVSREAPVLILRHRETQLVPGGGANAANNLADLGAKVLPVGVVGNDAAGQALVEYFRRKRVATSGILRVAGWTTPRKTRYLAGFAHTARQQVLRVDCEPDARALPAKVRAALVKKARGFTRRASAALVSDYGFGVASPAAVSAMRGKLVLLDSRFALLDYKGSGITAATPNEPEIEALHHTRIGTDTKRLEALGAQTLRAMKLEALLVTRGKDGMALFLRGRKPVHIPVYGTDQALDVTGAGDTVIAVFTLALAAGGTFTEAAHLANYAGGIVVMKRGTATVTREELVRAIQADLSGSSTK
ncbi:MAG: bifunctional ADP-heptose synthase [Acidobacteria bacterium]|nr:bifunctional ADP-heptose synthase [Acidobacteriota bacterium]MCL5289326.1 bifunctional ADP-heptose synthase [Acidobacteriota bacterium]